MLACALSVSVAWSASVAPSRAAAAPVLVTLEGDGALPLTEPQRDLFGPGGAAAIGVMYPLLPQLLVGGRLRGLFLLNGNSPADPGRVDPGFGSLEAVFLTARLRPFGLAGGPYATGLFLDGGFGAGLTGEENRATLEAGLGFGFDAGGFVVAPVARYLQVIQPADPLSEEDARLVLAGVELTFGDERPKVEAPPPPPTPSDRDGDGLADVEDSCPDEPEDHDGHLDQDGCPDPDNDGDGILDGEDDCPDEPEDMDDFEDDDGCPDPDNDQDGFPDEEDECPNEAEIVNGNKDYDGCPDEGLIEFKDDRIVLEERVLFDLERARVKRAARPILRAIVKLQSQHPEWIALRIEGHADKRGDEEYNKNLSQRRANNVREVLVRLGIPKDMIEAVGYGATRPRDKRDDPEAFQRNRRVEFVVLARHEPAKSKKAATNKKPAEAASGDPAAAPEAGHQPVAPNPPSGEAGPAAEGENGTKAAGSDAAEAATPPSAEAPTGQSDGLDEFLQPGEEPEGAEDDGEEPASDEEVEP